MTAGVGSTQLAASSEARYPPQSGRLYFDLSVYWFALSFLWAGTITVVIQTLVAGMAGVQKDLYLGLTLGAGALVSTLVCLVVGTMSDRSRWRMGRRRPYLIAGTLLAVPALLWLSCVSAIWTLVIDFCLIQLWVNAATAPYQALLPDSVPRRHQGTASAYMGMASLLGQLSGLISTGLLIQLPESILVVPAADEVRLLALPDGLGLIVLLFSALLVLTMAYTVLRVREKTAQDNPAPNIGLSGALAESFKVDVRAHPDFFRLIASRFVINMGFYSVTEFLLYYLGDTLRAPDPVRAATTIFVIATAAGLVGNFPAGVLSDRISKKKVVYASTALAGVGVLVFLFARSLDLAFGAAFVFGVGFGAFLAVDWAFATNLLPERDEAKHMGVWHVAFTVPQVLAPLFGGLVAYTFNIHLGAGTGYRAIMVMVAFYLVIGTLMIRPIRERSTRPRA